MPISQKQRTLVALGCLIACTSAFSDETQPSDPPSYVTGVTGKFNRWYSPIFPPGKRLVRFDYENKPDLTSLFNATIDSCDSLTSDKASSSAKDTPDAKLNKWIVRTVYIGPFEKYIAPDINDYDRDKEAVVANTALAALGAVGSLVTGNTNVFEAVVGGGAGISTKYRSVMSKQLKSFPSGAKHLLITAVCNVLSESCVETATASYKDNLIEDELRLENFNKGLLVGMGANYLIPKLVSVPQN